MNRNRRYPLHHPITKRRIRKAISGVLSCIACLWLSCQMVTTSISIADKTSTWGIIFVLVNILVCVYSMYCIADRQDRQGRR
mgnify:FL=1